MADFAASLTNPTTSIVGLSCDGTNITINDWSNYIASTESGNQLAQFSAYKKITVTNPDATTYDFSTTVPRDEAINTPSTYVDPLLYPPIPTLYAYDGTDGVYVVNLLTIPYWGAAYTYELGDTVVVDIVVAVGGFPYAIYEALATGTNKDPKTETAYWVEVTDEDDVEAKYNITERIAVTCVLDQCLADKLVQASCQELNVICDDEILCENSTFRKAMRLDVILAAIDELVESESWGQITDLINSGNTICNCCD